MPKRKLAKVPSADESDLTPPPDDLAKGVAALAKVEAEGSEQPVKKQKTAAAPRKRQVKKEVVEEETEVNGSVASPKVTSRNRRLKTEQEDPTAGHSKPAVPAKRQRKTKAAKEEEEEEEEEEEKEVKPGEQKVKKKRKTKEEKEAEAMPLAARTAGHKLFIGAHVSSAGGVQNAPLNSLHIGANAFALFLKSQRKWANPPLSPDHTTAFLSNCKTHSYDQAKHALPHGSYLVNLAHTDPARTTQAYTSFLDDLKRCEALGINLYNFHPGVANSTNGDRGAAIAHLASQLNAAHKATSRVVTLLENMAAGGNVLGSTFEDLRDIIALVDDKTRVGVCLDTCHAFAHGYDLRSPEAFKSTMDDFEAVVGKKYLRALHMNDSKAPLGSKRDLHANIGTGFLGLRAFHNVVNEPAFVGLPMVLETPVDVRDAEGNLMKDEKGKDKEDKGIWAEEIKLLEGLVGMDVESEGFLEIEKRLSRKGVPERKRLMEQIERKAEKDAKKGQGKGKGAKKGAKKEESGSELSDLEESGGE